MYVLRAARETPLKVSFGLIHHIVDLTDEANTFINIVHCIIL